MVKDLDHFYLYLFPLSQLSCSSLVRYFAISALTKALFSLTLSDIICCGCGMLESICGWLCIGVHLDK